MIEVAADGRGDAVADGGGRRFWSEEKGPSTW